MRKTPKFKADPAKLKDRLASLRSQRAPWETLWQEIADYVMPRRSPGMAGVGVMPGTQREGRLFDTTAVQSNMTLANGCMAWMSPQESPWFAFETPAGRGDDDDAQRWLAQCTERARAALARSNYYTAQHEFYLDRSAFGTACLYVEQGRKHTLNVQCWPVGSFCIDEDDEGNVDTVFREFELTVKQAVQKFGEEQVHSKVRDLYKEGGAKLNQKINFLHAIYPRDPCECEEGRVDGQNMPVASVYLDLDHTHIARESGYEEMPVMVSRYLEWGSGMGGLYGWSPSFAALPEVRQVNFLQKMMDALAEKMAFPPVLAPDELEGELDPSAGGVTYFDKTLAREASLPREWMTQGRYDVGLERVKARQAAIERAFHVELFQMFSQLDKAMTAREVAERANEKLIQFSPTFSRLTVELFNPLLERVFGVMLRAQLLGHPPVSMIEVRGNMGYVTPPSAQFSSRIALSLRSMHGAAIERTVQRVGALMQLSPEVAMHFDWQGMARDAAINDGIDPDRLRPLAEVKQEQEAQTQAAAQMQQQQSAMATADVMSKLGSVKQDSAMVQGFKQQQPAPEA